MDPGPYFLTPKLLQDVVSEYQWHDDYLIEDDEPDGVILKFPNCELSFSEDCDGGVDVKFSTRQTNTAYNLHLFHALLVFFPEDQRVDGRVPNSQQTEITYPFPTLENTTNGVHWACRTLLELLPSVLQGDFSWVDKYRAMYPDTFC